MPKGVYARKPITEKTRAILSATHKGIPNPRKGKIKPLPKCPKCNIELKDYRSKFCRKCSPRRKGFKHSEETKAKMRGRIPPNYKGGKEAAKIRWKKQRRFWCLRRWARKHNAEGNHSFNDWETLKAQYNWTCLACKKQEPEIILTEDHIIPLIKGGSNNIENIQPLCKLCNSKKHIKIIKY